MPVYEYTCEDCEHTTEAIRGMSHADDPIACEACGSRKTHRAHSVFASVSRDSTGPAMPMAGCGRCGDPRGSCPMN